MAVFGAPRTALGSLARNPVLFVGSFPIGLVTLPQSVLALLSVPLAPTLFRLVTYFLTPFLLAGLIDMVVEAQRGGTGVGTLSREGKAKYVPLLLGTLLRAGIQFAFGAAVLLVAVVGAVTVLGATALFSPVEVAVFGAVSLVITTLVLAFRQSYAVAFFTAVRD